MLEAITGLIKDNSVITGVLLNECPALLTSRLVYPTNDLMLPVDTLQKRDILYLTTDQKRKDFEFHTLDDGRLTLMVTPNSENTCYFEELAVYNADDISEAISNPYLILASLRSQVQYTEQVRLYSPHGLKEFIAFLHSQKYNSLSHDCEVNNAVWVIYHHMIPGPTWKLGEYTVKFCSNRNGGNC